MAERWWERSLTGVVRAQVVLAVGSALVLGPTAANADPWPYPATDIHGPDGGGLHYCFHEEAQYEPTGALKDKIILSMDYIEANTSADVFEVACDRTSTGGQTDVIWIDRDLDYIAPGLVGTNQCVKVWANGTCDRSHTRVDREEIQDAFAGAEDRRMHYRTTSCHELGHALGLVHYAWNATSHDSCMRSGPIFPDDAGLYQSWPDYTNGSTWYRQLTSHHLGHINAWFTANG